MLHLLLGTDWVAVREEILHQAARDVHARQGGRIVLVPELISHDMERRLCAAAGDTASRYAEVLSFTRLIRRVSEYTGCPADNCMDNGGRVIAMAASARMLHSQLKAYAAVETKPEFLSALVDAVDEFKRCGISAADLSMAAGQTQGSFAQKLQELSLLLEAYDGLCQLGNRDPRDLMNWLLGQLQDSDFGESHTFYIDGFPDFTRQHLAILEHLIRVCPSVTVGLNCDRPDSEQIAFEKTGDTASQLIRCAQRAGVPVQIHTLLPQRTAVMPACEALFQGRLPQVPGDVLTVVQADSAFHEVQLAADRILELVHNGCRYRDISVVCTDMGVYKGLIRLEFHRCGIPLYESGTENVLEKSVISTVLSALDAALGGFETRDVLRYLHSAISPVGQEICDRMENYTITWGIRGSKWLLDWQNHPDGLEGEWTEYAKNCLQELNNARQQAMLPLERLRSGFRNARKLTEQVQALYDFLEEIEFARRLSAMANEMDSAGDNRSAQILNQIWDILMTALEQLYDVLGQTAWEDGAFLRLFALLLSQYDVGTIPPVLDAVMVGPGSAMRCQQAKHLIVLGAEEGKLPGYGGSTGILSDQERVALRDLGVPLTGGAMEGLQAEFSEIYGVFCGARESVFASCHTEQPSYVLRRLSQMAGGIAEAPAALGAAAADSSQAGAFLAAWKAADAAKDLQVQQWYDQTLTQAAFALGAIKKENVLALYGDTLVLSASQVDCQAQCRLSYFLKYGIRARERKEATVDPAEFGTYVHAVLEDTARTVMEQGGFHNVSREQTMQIALDFADAYMQEHFSQLDSQRLSYLFRRNRRELEMVVEELWQELKDSDFLPQAFELAFGRENAMPAIQIPSEQMHAILRGFVDRVDIWQENGQHYFRVVDYKTGKKSFDYCDVFNGVGLQMLLYLFALEHGGQEIVGDTPVAAGVQYFPARVPVLAADGRLTQQEAEALRRREWKRKGLLLHEDAVLQAMDPSDSGRLCCIRKKDGTFTGDLADRQQLKLLQGYVMQTLSKMVDDIAAGKVNANPYTRGTAHDPCAYCPYDVVCHSKTVEGRRNYKMMSAERFWEEVRKENGHGE